MPRRIHCKNIHLGEVALTAEQAHHLRKVLRLSDGETVELFDDSGNIAPGVLRLIGSSDAKVEVKSIDPPPEKHFSLTIAAAIPKGERADWMVEKLSELGVDTLIPIAAARSVVLPEGRNKHDRWIRIAAESAKQCRRAGTMQIETLAPLDSVVATRKGAGWVCNTAPGSLPITEAARTVSPILTLFVGPEGGWTAEEAAAFAAAEIASVALTQTVLRVETAAIAAASVLMISRRL